MAPVQTGVGDPASPSTLTNARAVHSPSAANASPAAAEAHASGFRRDRDHQGVAGGEQGVIGEERRRECTAESGEGMSTLESLVAHRESPRTSVDPITQSPSSMRLQQWRFEEGEGEGEGEGGGKIESVHVGKALPSTVVSFLPEEKRAAVASLFAALTQRLAAAGHDMRAMRERLAQEAAVKAFLASKVRGGAGWEGWKVAGANLPAAAVAAAAPVVLVDG